LCLFHPLTLLATALTLYREILQPRDMITIPGDNSTFINFCGQFCLSVFRQKKKPSDKIPDKTVENKAEKPPEKPAEQPPDRPICSVCRVSNRVRDMTVGPDAR